MIRAVATSLALCLATPAAAQSLIAEYYAIIGPEDMRNSSGQRLGDYCQMVQQDRANYHRFGIRHDGDQGDPVFGSRENRARIAGRCRIMRNSEYIPNVLESGQTRYIWVRVYGRNGVPSELLISEGAG